MPDQISYQPPFGKTLAAFQNLDSIEFQFYTCIWSNDDPRQNESPVDPIAVLKGIQARDRRVKTFTLTETPFGPMRRVYSLVLPLQGVPEWTESFVAVGA